MNKFITFSVATACFATSSSAEFYEPSEAFSLEQIKMIEDAYDESAIIITPETAYDPNEAFGPDERAMIKRAFNEAGRANAIAGEQFY